MNKRRLLKLADLLETDAKNPKGIKFNLEDIVESQNEHPTWDCGTTGCAIGLAIVSGAFKRQGLCMASGWRGWEPSFNGETGFGRADAKFFDLLDDEHYFLFMPGAYQSNQRGKRGELRVAKRIRDFVAGKVTA